MLHITAWHSINYKHPVKVTELHSTGCMHDDDDDESIKLMFTCSKSWKQSRECHWLNSSILIMLSLSGKIQTQTIKMHNSWKPAVKCIHVLGQTDQRHTLVDASREELATEEFDHWIEGLRTHLRCFTTTTVHHINKSINQSINQSINTHSITLHHINTRSIYGQRIKGTRHNFCSQYCTYNVADAHAACSCQTE